MDPRHCNTLELFKVLERLASHASFSAGAEKARNLMPSVLLQEVRERLQTTTEARTLLEARPQTTLGGARDVRPQVEAARRGAVLVGADLLDVRGTLTAARTLKQTLARLERQFPLLADIASRIAPCQDLVASIDRCLDERGEVQDSASADLAAIRRELKVTHDRLHDRLQRIISSPKYASFLQEPIITIREGRYVIPLKANFKGRIRGVIHDRSTSGATLFIEPLGAVELGNAWRELQIREEQEIQRILADLSAQVAACGAEIVHTVDALADLDLAFAKARYAEQVDGAAPSLSEDGPSVRLLQARHPLLDPETVVPIDVVLEKDTHVLVITGPNTGGKTVTLRTVGLLTLMAQAGMHIPVAPGSAIGPFEAVYADIGDEQSIEQSLSTFSSHLTNIVSFIGRTDDRSLVLLDELGAGTDPGEGSALARALLEALRRREATTFVATHYPELKAYAQLTPGVKNACVEFDPETLRPTYHLTVGLPGRSNAFAIARRLGLDEEIARQAEGLIRREDRQTESLLADLHQLRLEAAEARNAAASAQAEARRQAEDLRRRMASIEEERAAILEEAHREAASELERFGEEVRTLRERLQATTASLEEVAAVEADLEELADLQADERALVERQARQASRDRSLGGPIHPGDTVWVEPLGAPGEVLTVEGGQAEVQVGRARTRVELAQLERRAAREPAQEAEPSGLTYEVGSAEVRLHLRGCTTEEALERLDRHLDAASLAGLPWIEIVHGKGTGTLRRAVREFLRTHPLVSTYRPGEAAEGGEGVTVAKLVQG